MSGERKALIIFIFLLIMHYSQGKFLKFFFLSILTYLLLLLLSNYMENPYLKTKIDTLTNFLNTGNFDYFIDTGEVALKDSYSNVQRAFALSTSKVYFLENPFFGIGTNNFINFLNYDYHYLPEITKKGLLAGIHNEFQRVVVENGLLGLFFYLLIWFKSWTRTKNITLSALKYQLINNTQYRFCTYSLYLTCFIYVGTEASSLRSFIILIFISLLPDFFKYHFQKKINN